jgi:hypothetical protein
VDIVTVKALLSVRARKGILPGSFHFCADPACDLVYFSADQRFRTAEIRVPVWQKKPFGARMVCYCFGENEADMRREIEATGACVAAARVREYIAAKRCACESRNPRGACCLGDVLAAVERVETARQATAPS